MNLDPARLEILPNELLIQICKYLDAGDIYRAFYNLNFRFNKLIQSVNELCLTLSLSDDYDDVDNAICFDNISTLIVNKNVNVTIGQFPNLRRLILHWLSDSVIDKIEYDFLPYLEYLYIDSRQSSYDCSDWGIFYKIFTNGFPQLKYISVSKMDIQPTTSIWFEIPSINILKVGYINLSIYEKILSSCPNLSLFEFGIDRGDKILNYIKDHMNIKTSVIKMKDPLARWGQCDEGMYLPCLPNLKRLNIRIENLCIIDAITLCENDWLTHMIGSDLSKLRRVDVYLPIILDTETSEFFDKNVLNELKESWEQIYKNRSYQMEVIIDWKTMVD